MITKKNYPFAAKIEIANRLDQYGSQSFATAQNIHVRFVGAKVRRYATPQGFAQDTVFTFYLPASHSEVNKFLDDASTATEVTVQSRINFNGRYYSVESIESVTNARGRTEELKVVAVDAGAVAVVA